MTLSKTQLRRMTKLLGEREAELRTKLDQTRPPPGQDRYDDIIGGVPDQADKSFARLTVDMDDAFAERAVTELRAIESARRLMDAGLFGTCVGCGESIEFERLEASPLTRRCLACQEAHERRLRQSPGGEQ